MCKAEGRSLSVCLWYYLYSLDTCTDNLSVVISGAEWTRMLALPQEMETATIARPLRTVTVKKNKVIETFARWKRVSKEPGFAVAQLLWAKRNICWRIMQLFDSVGTSK